MEEVDTAKTEESLKMEEVHTVRTEESLKMEEVHTAKTEESLKMEEVNTAKTEESAKMEEVHTARTEESLKIKEVHTSKTEESAKMEEVHTAKTEESAKMEEVHTARTEESVKMEEADTARSELKELTLNPESQAEVNVAKVKEFIKCMDVDGLKNCILEGSIDECIFDWDVSSHLLECLTHKNFEEQTLFFETCEACMNKIVQNGNAKELLLAILEQIDRFNDDTRYKTLLRVLQLTMLRLPPKLNYSLEIVLPTVFAHIKSLMLPDDFNLEGEEKLLVDVNPECIRISDCISEVVQFLNPFVQTYVDKKTRLERSKDVDDLAMQLLRILDHPLAFMDLSIDENKAKSTLRAIAEKIVQFIIILKPDVYKLIHGHLDQCSDSEETVSGLSLACLAYLVLCENVSIDSLPFVHSNLHKMNFYLKLVSNFLERKESFVICKGIALLRNLLEMFNEESVLPYLLENELYFKIIDQLITITIHCAVKELRQSSLRTVTDFMRKFIPKGRYFIFQHILNTCQHSGFNGYTIQLIKEQIDVNFKMKHPNAYFMGNNLYRLLKLAMHLPDGPATDLLENCDMIITTLNLIRYLSLRDSPAQNCTEFWNFVDSISSDFLNPLRTGIDMSKAHYNLEISNAMEGRSMVDSSMDVSVSIGLQSMPQLTGEQRISMLKNAVNTFDMIDSLLCRVVEIIDSQVRSLKKITLIKE